MSKHLRTLIALLLTLALLLPVSAFGLAEAGGQSVNVAVTSTIGTLNPLLMDATEVIKYATSLTFLASGGAEPGARVRADAGESITTEDNETFTITLREEAVWSDGTPVTTEDVLFTYLCMTSPECGNTGMSMQAIVGRGRRRLHRARRDVDRGYHPRQRQGDDRAHQVEDRAVHL